MSNIVYYILCVVLTLGVLIGLSLMSRVRTAVRGNMISILCTAGAVVVTMYKYEILSSIGLWICMILGLVCGLVWSYRIKMIQMPQVVALLNSFGGIAAALIAVVALLDAAVLSFFGLATGAVALVIGMVTFTGSLVAAGKLHKVLPQKPVVWPHHQAITTISLTLSILTMILVCIPAFPPMVSVILCLLISGFFGIAFAIRVGGADMPITISLLVSCSGVADGIAGMAINNLLLVALGGTVGASGLLLTQIMCKAMNRHLSDILLGKTSVGSPAVKTAEKLQTEALNEVQTQESELEHILQNAKKVIIIPGYGMALAQAQTLVRQLAEALEKNGAQVDYAIHPVAGRMPGHMNVLLAEADVDYDKLRGMDDIDSEFEDTDLAIIVGANDVVNPAANTAEGTPIYGMPVLSADKAKHLIICNYDRSPGYAGVDNPLYTSSNATLMLGDAKQTVAGLISLLCGDAAAVEKDEAEAEQAASSHKTVLANALRNAKKAIIIPGYGMALAQAQTLVRQLAEKLEQNGAQVDYAIHPVAGRMPGHMNVLLAEADVDYDKLRGMDDIDSEFEDTDLAIIVGANDVVNPAANTAEGTPIYGMPVLSADKAKHLIICNYDRSPGYAGVDNPLYTSPNATLMLGDARKTVAELISIL